ncbi:MAG: HyaD/HybD family hydrogenase maturation endopeptidase, partial [Gemmatimonadota bacterium]|nr:HyaD/HybD family hydrogenase maturation endopeptidase [Gemmatimonadota bacterium]
MGLGNPLMGDDGTGLAALERLQLGWRVPDAVELVDGGTWGMNLLPMIETARRVLFLDAIRTGRAPGTEVVLRGDEIPRALALKLSPHQIDLKDVLGVAALRGTTPEITVAVGLEPGGIEMGDPISPPVAEKLDRLVEMAIEQLRAWGHHCQPRTAN